MISFVRSHRALLAIAILVLGAAAICLLQISGIRVGIDPGKPSGTALPLVTLLLGGVPSGFLQMRRPEAELVGQRRLTLAIVLGVLTLLAAGLILCAFAVITAERVTDTSTPNAPLGAAANLLLATGLGTLVAVLISPALAFIPAAIMTAVAAGTGPMGPIGFVFTSTNAPNWATAGALITTAALGLWVIGRYRCWRNVP